LLTDRQASTANRLADAAVDELRVTGYEALTVRNVARRAGVAPATAYTYFASKDHLIAEAFWRRLEAVPRPALDRRRSAAGRVRAALGAVTTELLAQPQLAAAATTAMLAADPGVRHVRDRIGADIRGRLADALDGGAARGPVLRALELAVSGAMLQAGMGHLTYDELPDLLGDVAELLVK
jgi:AcrR family transcriptional regulator